MLDSGYNTQILLQSKAYCFRRSAIFVVVVRVRCEVPLPYYLPPAPGQGSVASAAPTDRRVTTDKDRRHAVLLLKHLPRGLKSTEFDCKSMNTHLQILAHSLMSIR